MAKTTGRGDHPLTVVGIVDRLARDSTSDPALEIRVQNQELIRALETNALRQNELSRVNAQLEETNKAVLTVEALRELGYAVRRAADSVSALRVINSGEPLGLFFTDVILPGGMTGRELADAALTLRPGLRVLFASG